MVKRCLDSDSRFGVVLIKSGSEVGEPAEPHSVGSLARIVQVNKLDDGRMLIAVQGESRFQIEEITQLRPYMEGRVKILGEGQEAALSKAELQRVRDAVTRHTRLTEGLKGGWVREARVPEGPVALSYFIGAMLRAGVEDKQALLDEPSPTKRLQAALSLLEREAEGLREQVERELGGRASGG